MRNRLCILFLALSMILLLCAGSAGAEGILPVLQTPPPEETYAISLQSTTGAEYSSLDQAEGGGYKYNYPDVSYACYTRFSQKLAEEGYLLVSAETLEDGTSRAVVTDGTVALVIDYNLETHTASVSYPPSVFARDTALYDDYTEIKDGDVIQVTDHATATVTGWQWKNYVKFEARNEGFLSGNGINCVTLCFDVDYFRPETIYYGSLFRNPVVRYDGQEVEYVSQGLFDNKSDLNNYTSKYGFSGKMEAGPFALVFKLTDEQLKHPEKTTVTFADHDNAVRYVYRLVPALTDEALTGVWYGTATSSDEGAPPLYLKIPIWTDGGSYFAFSSTDDGSYSSSSCTTLNWLENTIDVDISNGVYKEAKGTYELADGVLTMKLAITRDKATYTYQAELRKDKE